MQRIKAEKDTQEMKECSFKPQLNPLSIRLAEEVYGKEPF